MKKVKFFIIFSLIFFLALFVGCSNETISEIDFYVDEAYATSVSFKDDNPEFLYKDKLKIELYKNDEFVKIIEDYRKINDLEPLTEYLLKFEYYNGDKTIQKGVSFRTKDFDDITLSVADVFATSVSIIDDNDTFIYINQLIVNLYKNDEFVKKIDNYKTINELEPDTEYILKYQYINGEEEVKKELSFKTNKLEEINFSIKEISFDSISLDTDNPYFYYLDTLTMKLYQGEEFISDIDDINNVNDLIINSSYRIEYQYFNGNEIVKKELLFNTPNHKVLSDDNSFIANFYYISHIKVTVNDQVVLDRDTTSKENEFKIENLNITDNIKIVVTSKDSYYQSINSLYELDLTYSQYFIDTFKYNNGYVGLNDHNINELVFESNYVVLDGKMTFIGEIEDETFMNYDKIETIIFNDSFEIGKKAFYNCDNLKTLCLNNMTIGNEAFADCDNLISLAFNGIIEFGAESFANCDNLKEIDFRNCSFKELTDEIIIMQGYDDTTKSLRVFADCKNLSTVYLAVNQPLTRGMFEGCTNLTSVVNIGTIKLFPSNVFKDCINLENVTINSGCLAINPLSFGKCNKIQELFISKDCILKICAFEGCNNLVIKTNASSRPEKWSDDFCEETCEIIYNQIS